VFVRVVRFTDVSSERLDEMQSRIKESDGPPPGVPATAIKVLIDESARTAVVLQYYATAEDMETGAKVFGAMDASETPGNRASVDECEIRVEMDAPN
jgi:hypothetical protein